MRVPVHRPILSATLALASAMTLLACGDDSQPATCAGACDAPPADFCEGDVLRSFPSVGTCVGTACAYVPTDTLCAAGCADGACQVAPPCEDSCPELQPECVDGQVVRRDRAGCSDDGTCLYDESREDCAALGQICEDA